MRMPWWGILLLCIGCMMLGACIGLFTFALLHAASEHGGEE